jgi:Na+/melibiose symporter-like transporter
VTGIALSFSLVPALLMLASLFVLGRYRLRERDLDAATETGNGEPASTEGSP